MSKYPKSEGAIFANKKERDNHPDLSGKLEITKDQIKMLIEMGKAGQQPALQVAGWNRKSQAGQSYVYLSAEAYMKTPKPENDMERFTPDDDELPF